MSISTWNAGPATPLAQAMQRSPLSNKKLDVACAKYGIDGSVLRRFAAGNGRPVPWLARAIADMFGSTVSELFPRLADEDTN